MLWLSENDREGNGMADRVFAPRASQSGSIVIEGDEAHHLGRVRRIGLGQVVEVFDGQGFASRAEVVAVDRSRLELRSIGEPLPDRVAPVVLTLASALPKGDRVDWLVEKAVELGVARFVPIVTSRSVVDPRPAKVNRLRRAVIEASKQCGRNRLMVVEPPIPWADLLGFEDQGTRLIAHPLGESYPRWPRIMVGSAATIAVGPEGGFTDNEVEEASKRGWTRVSLGATLLRIETAGLVGTARVFAQAEGASTEPSGKVGQ